MICGVPASASEAETAGIFLGAQEAVPVLNTLVELGHLQPSHGTPIETDNSTAHDIHTAQVCMKLLKHATRATTGSKIGLHKASLLFSGLVAKKTVETTSLKTIHRHIIC